MKKVFFVLIAFFMLNLQSFATTWVQVGDHEFIDKDNINYYTDDQGNTRFEQKAYWMKTTNRDEVYELVEKRFEKTISYVVTQRIMDTNRKSTTIKSIIYYDEQGYPIMSYAKKDFELTWDAVVPNTNGEFWYELVRKPRHLKKMYKYQLEQQNNK